MANIDRTGRQPVADADLADATGRDDCCNARRRQLNSDGATVAVAGIGCAMMLCCAGPALLSTGLLSTGLLTAGAGAGVVFGAGAIGVVAVTALLVVLLRIRRLRVDTGGHEPTLSDTFGRPPPERACWTIRPGHGTGVERDGLLHGR